MSNHSKQSGFFIKGDVSGIQEFIFNVKSEKAARVLNVRSAYIQMYTRIVKEYLKEQLKDIGTVEEFSEGGGSFFLFLESNQSSEELESIIKEKEREANAKGMIDDLYIVLSVVGITDKDNFDYWNSITEVSNKDKLRKYALAGSQEVGGASPFHPFADDSERYDWTGFAHEFPKRGIKQHASDTVDQSPYLSKTQLSNLITTFSLSERISSVTKDRVAGGLFKDKIQNKLPEWHRALRKAYEKEINAEVEKRKEQARFKGTSEQDEEIDINSIIDYSFLAYFASERTGTEKLGILKMDVDNLGLLFEQQKDQEEAKEISKDLKFFFEERLYELLQGDIKYKKDYKEHSNQRPAYPDQYKDNIYTVFAGGDDCFFVGGWDTILDWAALVRKEFKSYVTEKNIIHPKTGKIPTISAGVVIVGAKFPVIRFAELAEEALSKAKASNRWEAKNKICLFDQMLTWNEFIKAKKWANKLKALIENDEKKSTLEQIKRSAIGFEKLQEKAIDGKISAPKIANLFYYIRRNINEKNIETIEELVEEYKDALLEAFIKNRQRFSSNDDRSQGDSEDYVVKTNPMLLPIAARWAEFLTRKNTKSDKNGKG